MPTPRHSRPPAFGYAVSSTSLSIVRILIASYFLATATRLVSDPASESFLARVMDPQTATLLATLYIFPTAFLVMVGYAVRPAALLLAIYVFWSSYTHYGQGQDAEALAALWRNIALLGGLMLVAMTTPGGSKGMHLRNRTVTPRRVQPSAHPASSRPPAPAPGMPSPSADFALAAAALRQRAATGETKSDKPEGDDNIFREGWETARSA